MVGSHPILLDSQLITQRNCNLIRVTPDKR